MSVRKDALKALSRRRGIERGLTSFAAIAVIPGACALLGAFTPDLHKDYGADAVILAWVFLILLLGIFAIRLNPTGESLLTLIVENEELEEKITSLEEAELRLNSSINLLAFQASYASSARAIILAHARSKPSDLEGFIAALSDLAVPLSYQCEYLFDIGPSEAWNFGLYLYSEKKDILIPVWRKKATNHPSPQGSLGRRWQRGEGHVGKAFVDQKTIITGNAQDPEAAPLSSVPPGKSALHDSAYVSFAAIPIGPILDDDKRPYGVLVGTSDRPGRFHRDNAGILVQIAGAVASLLITAKLDVDDFVKDETLQTSKGV